MSLLYPLDVFNCRGRLLDLKRPIVMGILNVTPDSFYDGGKYETIKAVLDRVEHMVGSGASIIDIGAESTRPGASKVSASEQIKRLSPILPELISGFPTVFFSIDANEMSVVKYALDQGVHIVNDVFARLGNEEIIRLAASTDAPYICMHMQQSPSNMQNDPSYEDVSLEVLRFFIDKIGWMKSLGLHDIIIDPGFGFGKTVNHNYELLMKLESFKILELPLLVGISRKSMITKVLNTEASGALNATSALHMIALQKGAKILRVHDVKAAMDVISIWEQLYKNEL